MPYLLFLNKRQNLKLSSAANYRWRSFVLPFLQSDTTKGHKALFQTWFHIRLFRRGFWRVDYLLPPQGKSSAKENSESFIYCLAIRTFGADLIFAILEYAEYARTAI